MGTTVSFMIMCWWLCILLVFDLVDAKAGRSDCVPSSCGHIQEIRHPFRLKHDPQHCGLTAYTLSCENNITIINHIQSSGTFYVQAINYDDDLTHDSSFGTNRTIRAVEASILSNNSSSIPTYSVTNDMFEYHVAHLYYVPAYSSSWGDTCIPAQNKSAGGSGKTCRGSYPVYFLQCMDPVNSSVYLDTAPCYKSRPNTHGYVNINGMKVGELKDGCSIERMSFVYLSEDWDASCKYIQKALLYGFEMTYRNDLGSFCGPQWSMNGKCFPKNFTGFFKFLWEIISSFMATRGILNLREYYSKANLPKYNWQLFLLLGLIFPTRFILGSPLVIAVLIFKWRRRHLSLYPGIEDFLHNENNFGPIKYSYSDIKKMTSRFKHKLGEGGYGCVFKGKLRSGHFGAIKLLGKSKGNGQEFINEVATIGRIHHTNVVKLVGYCVEGSKRALVYDFMPNGSLDKYIYSKEGSISLSYKQMYEIALGVAQGMEYLHQGCDMQILHFDIKPHNILLDQNFIPKISDFGLAKLYPAENNTVTLTAVRGTMGYMAPEFFYKNIGGVSYKADVYSFGMLLMEMASKRKNLNAMEEHSSQIYFPSWVYDQYSQGKDHLDMSNLTEEERVIIKKMVITALWCIQMKPNDRPSMDKVIEMLEGDVESLEMPTKLDIYPQEMCAGDMKDATLNPVCSNVELTCTLSAR